MVPATRTAHSIESTAESLQEDLARLEQQKRALERELAAVAAHLDSVQRALNALSVLMADPARAKTATGAGASPSDTGRTVQARGSSPVADAPANSAAPARAATGQKRRTSPKEQTARAEKPGQQTYGKLTEQILEYFADVPDRDVRARDVAAALGRDTDNGNINAIRSTLDRLVGASRISRAGRGLYRAT